MCVCVSCCVFNDADGEPCNRFLVFGSSSVSAIERNKTKVWFATPFCEKKNTPKTVKEKETTPARKIEAVENLKTEPRSRLFFSLFFFFLLCTALKLLSTLLFYTKKMPEHID